MPPPWGGVGGGGVRLARRVRAPLPGRWDQNGGESLNWPLALRLVPLVLVTLAVAQRSEGPTSSASISVTWWVVPSASVQVRSLGRPITSTRAPLARLSTA